MKKFMVLAGFALGIFAFLPATASAAPLTDTYVRGVVGAYDTSTGTFVSRPTVAGAQVRVECNGQVKTTNTDGDGMYSVRFLYNDCPDGSYVEVVATDGDLSGRNMIGSGQVHDTGSAGEANVTVMMHNYSKVSGQVRDTHGDPAGGAQVRVTCDGTTKTVLTGADGRYTVTFKAAQCQIGGPWAESIATKSGMTGSGSAPILDFTDGIASIDLVLDTPVASVPEMGTIASIGAGGLAAGAFLLVRRQRRTQPVA